MLVRHAKLHASACADCTPDSWTEACGTRHSRPAVPHPMPPHLLQRAVSHVVPERELACRPPRREGSGGERQGWQAWFRVGRTPLGMHWPPSSQPSHTLAPKSRQPPPTGEQLVHHDACAPHVAPLVVALLDDLQ